MKPSRLVRTALAKRIIEMAHRPDVDVQKLRDDAIAYVKNDPLWPSLWRGPAMTQGRPYSAAIATKASKP